MLLAFAQIGMTAFLLAVGFTSGYFYAISGVGSKSKTKTNDSSFDPNRDLDEDDRRANPFYD